MDATLSPVCGSFEIVIACAWDNYLSARSNPLNDLTFAAAGVKLAARIEIPMRIWAAALRHPQVQTEYRALAIADPGKPEYCKTCGAQRAIFRPVLDRTTFERLLHANPEGPVLPGSIIITESKDNVVLVRGRDTSLVVQILSPLHRLVGELL